MNFFSERGTAPSWGRRRRVRVVIATQRNSKGAFVLRLGKQRQEEMKSLIQNSLKLGEKPQTTEASIFKMFASEGYFCDCLYLRTSYNNWNKISIEKFKETYRIFEGIYAKSVYTAEKHCQIVGFLIP